MDVKGTCWRSPRLLFLSGEACRRPECRFFQCSEVVRKLGFFHQGPQATLPVRCACLPASSGNTSKIPKVDAQNEYYYGLAVIMTYISYFFGLAFCGLTIVKFLKWYQQNRELGLGYPITTIAHCLHARPGNNPSKDKRI